MTVYDLNRDQLIELKQNFITEQYDERGESPSWGELADADELITDEEIYRAYESYSFTNDDFSCSAGEDDPDGGSLAGDLQEAIYILNSMQRYQVIFDNPGLSSTEAKVKHGVQNALRELNKAYQAALELRY